MLMVPRDGRRLASSSGIVVSVGLITADNLATTPKVGVATGVEVGMIVPVGGVRVGVREGMVPVGRVGVGVLVPLGVFVGVLVGSSPHGSFTPLQVPPPLPLAFTHWVAVIHAKP